MHLHVHSVYSAMRGLASVEELCRRAAEQGFDSLALTDTNGLYGIPRFVRAAHRHGLKPVIGAELAHGPHRAVALVKDRQGYQNLCRLVSSLHCDPHVDFFAAVAKHRAGIVLATDDAAAVAAWRHDSAEDLYIEATPGRPLAQAVRLCRSTGLAALATNRVYLPSPSAFEAHRLLRAIALRMTAASVPASACCDPQHAFVDPGRFSLSMALLAEGLANTRLVAESCEDGFTVIGSRPCSTGDAAMDRTLRQRTYAGAGRRYGTLSERAQQRVEYELTVIRQRRLAAYFLLAEEVAARASRTAGRGSAAGSIVAYCLGITHVDPIQYGLMFERFVSPERREPPDIDIDVPWDERDRLLDWLISAHPGRAAMVSAHQRLGLRGAFREISRAYGLPSSETARLSSLVARYVGLLELNGNPRADTLARALLRRLASAPPAHEMLSWAARLQDAFRGLAVHCGGAVVSAHDLRCDVPIEPARTGVPLIQWDKDDVEACGLFKLDILGNRSLAVVRDTEQTIGWSGGDDEEPVRDRTAAADAAARDLIRRGDTIGCFHVESPATRQLLRKFWNGVPAGAASLDETPQPHDFFDDLTIISALIRPAAISYAPEVLRRARTERRAAGVAGPANGETPGADALLADTYGVLVFQDDVVRLASALAGMPPTEADEVRRAVSRKPGHRDVDEFCSRFLEGARLRGLSPAEGQRLWRMVLSFSGYSFCKAHAASYACLAMRCAFLRAHAAAPFMASVLSHEGGYYEPLAYVLEARRMGLTIGPPDINRSVWACTAQDGAIRLGFGRIRGLSEALVRRIVGERQTAGAFKSFEHFLARVTPPPNQCRRLILAGGFDGIAAGLTRPALMWRLHAWRGRVVTERMPVPPEYDRDIRARHEIEVFGFPLGCHPLDLYPDAREGRRCVEGRDMARYAGRRVTMIGWPIVDKLTHTRRGDPMAFLSFDDGTALYEAMFLPDIYGRHAAEVGTPAPHVLEGIVDDDSGAVSLRVTNMRLVRAGGAMERVEPEAVMIP